MMTPRYKVVRGILGRAGEDPTSGFRPYETTVHCPVCGLAIPPAPEVHLVARPGMRAPLLQGQ